MPPSLKFLSVSSIWGMATAITILQLVINDGANFNWLFSVVLFVMAAAATSSIMGDEEKKPQETPTSEANTSTDSSNTSKRKNDQAGGLSAEMMALLDEDDIEELRDRMKNRLIERIEGGGDGELSSLDALLSDPDYAPRKNRH